jgi:dolichol-phosphate mannosyltransferase
VAGIGFAQGIWALIARYITHTAVSGWTSIVILVSLIGGIQLIMFGILGIYLGKIFEEVKLRPLYLVRNKVGTFDD